MSTKTPEVASVFKLLSDPTRLKIIILLLGAKKDLCVGEIAEAVGSSQSATSHQLAKLESYRVVSPRREGQTICYVFSDNETARKIKMLLNIFK